MVTVFVIGVVVALLVDEMTGVTPGGIIVPGYLAIAWSEPSRLVATILATLLTVLIVSQLKRYIFVYGRRRFAYSVVTGIMLKQSLLFIFPALKLLSYGLLIIGYVIPGLLAENCLRQGIIRTMGAMILATAVTRLLSGAVLGWMP